MNQDCVAALQRAADILGGGAAVARVVNRRQPSVHQVLSRGKRAPAEWCIPLERATAEKGNIVTRHQLRPDIYPIEDSQKVGRAPRDSRKKNHVDKSPREAIRA